MSEKTEVKKSAFQVITLKNETSKVFIHEYDGERIVIGAGKQRSLPFAVARDCAYHLAQRILDDKGLPFFGQEHEEEINRLMGVEMPKEILIEDDDGEMIDLVGVDQGEDIVPQESAADMEARIRAEMAAEQKRKDALAASRAKKAAEVDPVAPEETTGDNTGSTDE